MAIVEALLGLAGVLLFRQGGEKEEEVPETVTPAKNKKVDETYLMDEVDKNEVQKETKQKEESKENFIWKEEEEEMKKLRKQLMEIGKNE